MTRRRAAPIVALAFLPALGCATAYTRGIVEDAGGAAVPGASVRLVGAGDRPVDTSLTDAHGCFFLQRTAPKGERRFTLEIGAEGYKSARLEVVLQPPILLATLATASSDGQSRIRPTTAGQRSEKWEPACIPLIAGGGAQQLAPN